METLNGFESCAMSSQIPPSNEEYEEWLISDEDALNDDEMCLLFEENADLFPSDALTDSYVRKTTEPLFLTEEEEEDGGFSPGYRFRPTNEELLVFYLSRRLSGGIVPANMVKDFDVYSRDPWLLPGADPMKIGVDNSFYFFAPYRKTSEKSSRAHRETENGFWKASTGDQEVWSSHGQRRVIGYFKQLTFHAYVDRSNHTRERVVKTDWLMDELKLTRSPKTMVCRIKYHKRSSSTVRGLAESRKG